MSSRSTKSHFATATLITVLIAGIILILPSSCRIRRGDHGLSEDVSNVKQIKLILDSFAMDFDGQYPNEKTAKFFEFPPPKSSDDFFRQLFVSGNTNSERVFWSRRSPVCSEARADDVTTTGGEFDPTVTLQPGDTNWAYFNNLKNTDNPALPLVLDPYIPGTTRFDRKLRKEKAIVLRIDGSAKPERISPGGLVLDGDAKNLLTTDSEVWKANTPDLRQPVPAP